MTLEQLRIFVEVAEAEHVTRAAERLNLTQSAVSAAVRALETRHATKLFDRLGRRIALTQAGRAFLPEARAVLDRARQAEQMLADFAGAATGILRLQASQTVASYWLPARMVDYRERFPRVELRLTVGNTASVAEAVAAGAAELGIVEGAVRRGDLTAATVATDELVLVVGPRHPWAGGRPVAPRELMGTAWILRERGSGTRAAFEDAMHDHGVHPAALSTLLELPSNEAVIAAVEAGSGAAVLSRRAAEPHVAAGKIMIAAFAMKPRRFAVLRHSERHVTRAMRAMLDLLHDRNGAAPVSAGS